MPLTAPPILDAASAPVVYDGSGFATVTTDIVGNVLLFTEANGSDTWTETKLYDAGQGTGVYDPAIATDGNGTLGIVATETGSGQGYLLSWIGQVGGSFTQEVVADDQAYDTNPSIAYSPTGENFVMTDIDAGGNVDYWYSTTAAGGWVEQAGIATNDSQWSQAVITTTDVGVVIVVTNATASGGLPQGQAVVTENWYQPYFSSGWSYAGGVNFDDYGLSIAWTGSEILLASAQTGHNYGQPASIKFMALQQMNDTGGYLSYGQKIAGHAVTGSTSIAWSAPGSNAVVTYQSGNALYLSYSNTTVTSFTTEKVKANTATTVYADYPSVVVGNDTVQITDATTDGKHLYGFSQPVGGIVWPRQTIYTG